jgi:hypothetical protein
MFSSRRSNIALLTVIAALVAAAASAPGASAAAQRYASFDGSGTDCSSAKPCEIAQAVNAAGDGDEVIVRPGSYTVTQTLENQEQVRIHGVAGEPRPRLHLNAASQVRLHLSELRYVEVIQNSPTVTAVAVIHSTLDQVIVRGGDQADCAVGVFSGTVRSSIVVARSQFGDGICTESYSGANNSTYLHVTAVARDGAAIVASASGATASVGVVAYNVIAKAGPSGAGFAAQNANLGVGAKINVLHSNYQESWTSGPNASVANLFGNQSLPPAFVDEANGDYRQRAGSPTIDAGKSDAKFGVVDIDGDPRQIGPGDIGADEFVVAPTAATGAASAVTEGAATLSGNVNPKGAPTSYRFEYGPTIAYGSSTSESDAGSGTSDVPASASLAGLAPGTTYHYRLVASNAAGVVRGADRTFTTAAASGTSGTGTQPPPPGTFAGVKLISTKLVLKRRFIVVKVSCPAGTAGTCAGVTKLSTRRPRTASRAARTVSLGRASFSIAAGGQARVRVRVSRAGRRLFAHTRRLRGRAASAAHDAAGLSQTTRARVTIRKG